MYSDKRTYSVLKRNAWTHVINEHFWNHTKLQCRLKYRDGRVYTSYRATKYLYIKGICTYYSTLNVYMDNAPQSENDVTMDCTYRGNYKIMHPIGLKRNLAGKSRITAIQKMTEQNLAPSVFRRHQANALMELGDPEPSHLPSGNVLRAAKCKSLREKRIHDDPNLSVAKAMHKIPYQGIIHDVSYDKLMIRYHSSAQLHVYNEYCKNNKFPSVFIDATGSIIKKITRDNGRNCGNIFLYSCVIRDQKAKQIYLVCNMISERHDTETIRHWLSLWLRDKVPVPREVVIDMQRALMSAVVQTFTQFPSLNEYIEECGKILISNKNNVFKLPNCFVRNDIAYLLKII